MLFDTNGNLWSAESGQEANSYGEYSASQLQALDGATSAATPSQTIPWYDDLFTATSATSSVGIAAFDSSGDAWVPYVTGDEIRVYSPPPSGSGSTWSFQEAISTGAGSTPLAPSQVAAAPDGLLWVGGLEGLNQGGGVLFEAFSKAGSPAASFALPDQYENSYQTERSNQPPLMAFDSSGDLWVLLTVNGYQGEDLLGYSAVSLETVSGNETFPTLEPTWVAEFTGSPLPQQTELAYDPSGNVLLLDDVAFGQDFSIASQQVEGFDVSSLESSSPQENPKPDLTISLPTAEEATGLAVDPLGSSQSSLIPTTTSVVASPQSVPVGKSVTLTASVSTTESGGGSPTPSGSQLAVESDPPVTSGTVAITATPAGGSPVSVCSGKALDSQGQVTCSFTPTLSGSYQVTASYSDYSGPSTYQPSQGSTTFEATSSTSPPPVVSSSSSPPSPESPVVTSVSPAAGPASGGETVDVFGENFSGATQVDFGGLLAEHFSVLSATEIQAVDPAGAGTVDVVVTTPVGTSAKTAADHFTYLSPPPPTQTQPITTTAPESSPAPGYWMVGADGGIFAFGGAHFEHSLPPGAGGLGIFLPPTPVVAMAADPAGGYWLVTEAGGVYSLGGAPPHGQLGSAPSAPVVAIVATPHGNGYWIADAAGEVFPFGSAKRYPLTGGVQPTSGVVGMAATPDGGGYWLVTSSGAVAAYGDATWAGEIGSGTHLAAPIVGIAATPDGHGYWLVGADGGVFTFGDAGFAGALPSGPGGLGIVPAKPVVGIAATPDGRGYWLFGADGGVYSFGDAPFAGALPSGPGGLGIVPRKPVVGGVGI